jgi:hypothetical protein
MGVWGTGAFENDDALAFCAELNLQGWEVVLSVLNLAERATSEEFLAQHAVRSLAAAEVVAAAIGRPNCCDVPRAVDEFLDRDAEVKNEWVDLASRAVRRCLRHGSQLRELWEDDPEWLATTEALLARLSPA